VPAKPEGVYSDRRGHWYFKVTLGKDPLTGRRDQLTRRGFRTATEAAKARHEVVSRVDSGLVKPARGSLTVDELLDLYLDGIDADEKLSMKTRYDYREKADAYVRPLLGKKRVRDVTPEVILSWQRKLLQEGGGKRGKKLAPNTIRLARAPLAGAFKLATTSGVVAVNPLLHTPRPTPKRSIPRHWSPEQAREFLGLMEGDRTYAIWALLMGAGLRIGELVALRWQNVDPEEGVVHVVEFATALGHEIVSSPGKSRDAVRSIDIDDALARVLKNGPDAARPRTRSSPLWCHLGLPCPQHPVDSGSCNLAELAILVSRNHPQELKRIIDRELELCRQVALGLLDKDPAVQCHLQLVLELEGSIVEFAMGERE